MQQLQTDQQQEQQQQRSSQRTPAAGQRQRRSSDPPPPTTGAQAKQRSSSCMPKKKLAAAGETVDEDEVVERTLQHAAEGMRKELHFKHNCRTKGGVQKFKGQPRGLLFVGRALWRFCGCIQGGQSNKAREPRKLSSLGAQSAKVEWKPASNRRNG